MKHQLIIATFSLGLLLMGCGGKTADLGKVSGTVTINGQPANGVRISFIPVSGGRPSTGMTNEKGEYNLVFNPQSMGALVGEHHVSIAAGEPGLDAGATAGKPLIDNSVPKEILEVKKRATVKSGSNKIDLSYP